MNKVRSFVFFPLGALICSCTTGLSQEVAYPTKEVIAILGTGDTGDSFGPRLADLGYKIVYGSRNPKSEKVIALLEKTGHRATATTNDLAAQMGDIVFLALPWGPMEQVIKSLGNMEGKTIVDLSWPENEFGEDGYFQITADPSGAEIIQSWIPKAQSSRLLGRREATLSTIPM